jgi:glyoxylase-like metal-dependent hydrolase (beta-lactamase superfamily II)
MDVRIISIGSLPAHPLWGERGAVRTGHATTTLLSAGETHILIDPGLPAQVLLPRLKERANLDPSQISTVFLTSFNPDARRALRLFDSATWLIHEAEREAVGVPMAQTLKELVDRPTAPGAAELRATLEEDIAVLRRFKPAPETLADRVDIFPLPGVTPGLCGLLVSQPKHTILICGDAVPTTEHLHQGQIPAAANVEQARESFQEAVEVADLLVLGRDNLVVNPTRRPF